MSVLIKADEGEDVPLVVEYIDDNKDPIAPDDTTVDPTITITDSGGTAVVSGVLMNELSVGEYEYVWDTDVDGTGPDVYEVRVSADFNAETDIETGTVRVE